MESGFATLWLVFALVLVLSMQAGFLMLEGGRVRSKNSINVAQKNISDLVVVWVVYFSMGFYIMFGISVPELVDPVQQAITGNPLHFVYQLAFCCTTATIVSGAVAERINFKAYLVIVLATAALIYPFVGRQVWGDAFNPNVNAWLGSIGFIDFAGSTVVHSVGAWIGLVAILMIGPRIGRFDDNGNVLPMPAFNSVIALAGVLIILMGWMGFNGGALLPGDTLLPLVLFSTLTAGIFGGFIGMLIGVWLDEGVFNPGRITSGLIGGLVACTAGVHFMSAYEAIAVGLLGGTVATLGAHLLLHKFKLDDPIDVVATHGLPGVLGTLAVPFIAPASELVGDSIITQFSVQAFGVLSVFVITCISSYGFLRIIDHTIGLRVHPDAERIGLNYTEHGESIGTERLQAALQEKIESGAEYSSLLENAAGDEHSELASTLQTLLEKYEATSGALEQSNRRFMQFAETASDWLWETDDTGCFSFISGNSDQAKKLKLQSLVGVDLLRSINSESTDFVHLRNSLAELKPLVGFEVELDLSENSPDSQLINVELRAVPRFDSMGLFAGYRGSMTDVTVRKMAEDKAQFLAKHDELTKLSNRRALSTSLPYFLETATTKKKGLVVLAVDLDGFKQINDAYGHQIGDLLLVKVATRMKDFLRPADIAFRTGGDEFVIVLNSLDVRTSTTIGEAISQRLIEKLSEPYIINDLDLRIGISIGLAAYPQHGASTNDLLRRSDMGLYEAKDRGKGQVVSFYKALDASASTQLTLEKDLRAALDNDQFKIMYQPQVNTATQKVTGYEALLRWVHPSLGEISPGQFVPVAEKLNLMGHIGHYVLESVCAFASGWQPDSDGHVPCVSVNLSAKQLKAYGFTERVIGLLEKYNLPAERLEFEISEHVLIHHYNEIHEVLDSLFEIGVSIGVDGFGRSHSMLRYIEKLPLSTLKIDRSFVSMLDSNNKAAEITETIVLLGQKVGINVLAEGVESVEQQQLLEQWSCKRMQGYLFSKPLDEKDISAQMREQGHTLLPTSALRKSA